MKYRNEKDVERQLAAGFYLNGADGHAFEPIVASGKNAATIHYQKNDSLLNKNDLLLLDIGALYGGYAADISRVWAVSGQPSPQQKELWEACLDIQKFAIYVTDVYNTYLIMKKDIHHKDYRVVVFEDLNNGTRFLTRSTVMSEETTKWEDGNEYPLVKVHISSSSHPFYTGQEKLLDMEGRVDKFAARQKAAQEAKKAKLEKATKQPKKRESTSKQIG